MPPHKYHVFLSHNSADKRVVEELARRLQAEKLDPFYDDWDIIPGESSQLRLAEALRDSQTCVVCLGPNGLGPWQTQELRSALDRSARGPEFRVIPLLLPGSERPRRGDVADLEFLLNNSWVEFLKTLDDKRAFEKLLWGITGVRPKERESERPLANGECPYRGLEVFRTEDQKFFFGRENLTGWLVSHLRREVRADRGTRFLAVLGPSGSGKSSLVLAGLVPQLKKGAIEGSQTWPIATMRVDDDPVKSLAVSVVSATSAENATVTSLTSSATELKKNLSSDEAALDLYVRLALRDAPTDSRLVIVVDQFEEIFTYRPDEEQLRKKFEDNRGKFLGNLLNAASSAGGRVVVVLSMRSDFLSACAPFPRLAAVMSAHQELVGPMTGDELREAIERPAFLAGCELEPGLTELLLTAVRERIGALPLLQFTLKKLWEDRNVRVLTRDAYKDMGGVEGALEKRANEILEKLPKEDQDICRQIFLRLTQPGKGTEDTKRRVRLTSLLSGPQAERTANVVKTLVKERLITTDGNIDHAAADSGGEVEGYVEVAHEALIRGWQQLRDWLNSDRAGLDTHDRLTKVAEEWEKSHTNFKKRDANLLYQGTRLAVAKQWAQTHKSDLNDTERTFLKASVDAIKLRRNLAIASVMAFLLLAIRGAVYWRDLNADAEVTGLMASLGVNTTDVPATIEKLKGLQRLATEPLKKRFKDANDGSQEKRHAAFALVGNDSTTVDPALVKYLSQQLLLALPEDVPVFLRYLKPHRQRVSDELWKVFESQAERPKRLRAASALAQFDHDNPRWERDYNVVARDMLTVPSYELKSWIENLRDVGKTLTRELERVWADRVPERAADREVAAVVLSEFCRDEPDRLAQLALQAENAKQFRPLIDKLKTSSPVPSLLAATLQENIPKDAPPEKEVEFWHRQANAGVCLLELDFKQIREMRSGTRKIRRFAAM